MLNNIIKIVYDPFTVNLLCGFIGSIIGAIISGGCTYFSIKREKKYFIELQVISDKILSPLINIYIDMKNRKEIISKSNEVIDKIVTIEHYEKILNILEGNICWIFAANNEYRNALDNIRKYSKERNDELLILEMENLYKLVEKRLEKYK